MSKIKTIGGTISVPGWCAITKTDGNGNTTLVLTGRRDFLRQALAYARTLPGGRVTVSSDDASTGVAEVTVEANEGDDVTTAPKPEETRTPDVELRGAMRSVPLHQVSKFGLGPESKDGPVEQQLTVQDIKTVDYLIREKGTLTQRDLDAAKGHAVFDYAGWILAGIKTVDVPVYTLGITYHLKRSKRDRVAALVKEAGTVLTFAQAVDDLPSKLRPYCPPGFDAWLAQAPTVKYTPTEITVSLSYVGAKAFPDFYKGGTWKSPSIAYRDVDVNPPKEPQA